MGRNESETTARPVKPRKRGRNKQVDFKPQTITFSCIFCNDSFDTTNGLFDHMRSSHANLCDIPQITADSEIVEEISGGKNGGEKSTPRISIESPPSVATNLEKDLSEDETSLDHLIEMVDSEDDEMPHEEGQQKERTGFGEDDEEEIESPPYERNSDAGSSYSDKDRKSQNNHYHDHNYQPMETQSEEGSGDEDYLSLMEPICELNCNESDGEEKRVLEIIKRNGRPKPGRGRRPAPPTEPNRGQQHGSSPISGDGFFQCTVCNKSFHFAGELARHVRSHTLNKPYQCSVSDPFMQLENIFADIINYISPELLQICDKSFTHIGSLNTHLRIHRGEKPYKCDKCGKAFTQSSSLMVHFRSHLSKKPISCQVCEKGFMNAISLQLHMKCHQGEEELFGCPKCDKKFKLESMLADHVMVHSQNLYQCSICRLQLPTGSDLVQHLKSHTGDKPFQCAICSKSFTQPGSLSTHTRIHTGEKPHQCPECDKSFTQASSLSVHMKIHSPEKPFWCHICERSYSQQAYFNKHMSFHQQDHQDKAQCPLCNVLILDAKKNMMKHFNKFHYDKKNKSFLCSICNDQYEDPQLLITHVKVHFQSAEEGTGID